MQLQPLCNVVAILWTAVGTILKDDYKVPVELEVALVAPLTDYCPIL